MRVRLIRPTSMVELTGIVDADKYVMDGGMVVTSDVPTIQKLTQDYGFHFFDVVDDADRDNTVQFKLIDFNTQRNDLRVDELMKHVYHDGYSYIGTRVLKVLLVRHSEPVAVEPIKQRRFTVGWAG